jgi:hypothetical protein
VIPAAVIRLLRAYSDGGGPMSRAVANVSPALPTLARHQVPPAGRSMTRSASWTALVTAAGTSCTRCIPGSSSSAGSPAAGGP